MFLDISISMSIAIIGLVILHVYVDCLQVIPWSFLLTLLAVFFIISMLIHAADWKCWHFIHWQPHRIHSVSRPEVKKRKDIIPQLVLYFWNIGTWVVYFTSICSIQWWWITIFTVVLLSYTAISSAADCSAIDSRSEPSRSEPSDSDADNVNADVSSGDTFPGGVVLLTNGISSSSSSSI